MILNVSNLSAHGKYNHLVRTTAAVVLQTRSAGTGVSVQRAKNNGKREKGKGKWKKGLESRVRARPDPLQSTVLYLNVFLLKHCFHSSVSPKEDSFWLRSSIPNS